MLEITALAAVVLWAKVMLWLGDKVGDLVDSRLEGPPWRLK